MLTVLGTKVDVRTENPYYHSDPMMENNKQQTSIVDLSTSLAYVHDTFYSFTTTTGNKRIENGKHSTYMGGSRYGGSRGTGDDTCLYGNCDIDGYIHVDVTTTPTTESSSY